MGCCVSSNIKALTSSVAVSQPPKPSEGSFQVEEEKVKEVLSETPKLNVPKTTTKTEPRGKPHQNIMAFDKFKEEESKSKVEKKALSINKGNVTSEICSLRKTMSISRTTAITGQREEGEETRKRVNGSPVKLQKTRSFSGDVGGRRDRSTVHGAPVRLIQCRDQVGQKMGNGGMRRRRNPGENSFRRSRPPATRADTGDARSVLGRSPSARRTNRSPVAARARTALPEKNRRKMEIPAMEGKRASGNESLENPLVSLECFIFI